MDGLFPLLVCLVDFKVLPASVNVNFSNSIAEAVRGSDLVILHTEWNDFKSINFKRLHPTKNLKIYDMRNIYSPLKVKSQGFKYFGIGR